MRKTVGIISSTVKSHVFMDLVRKKHQSIGQIVSFLLEFWGKVKTIVLDLLQRPISLDTSDAERGPVNGSTSS